MEVFWEAYHYSLAPKSTYPGCWLYLRRNIQRQGGGKKPPREYPSCYWENTTQMPEMGQ